MGKMAIKNLCILSSLFALAASLTAGITPTHLQCEYQTDPLAIDQRNPVLGWQLIADRPAEIQTAYRILVASSAELLEQNRADLWDSKKVFSSKQSHIPYEGVPLKTLQACYWKVIVYGRDGISSKNNPCAKWTMGILNPEDWNASFIELPAPQVGKGLKWIWYPGELFAPPGDIYFRKCFSITETPRSATFYLSADNHFELFINGHNAGDGNTYTRFIELDILPFLKLGKNQLAIKATNIGTQNNEAGLIGQLNIQTIEGSCVQIPIDTTWSVSNKEFNGWEKDGFTENNEWTTPTVRGEYGCKPWGKISTDNSCMPIFRKEFFVGKKIQRALVHICGLGQYELSLNGTKVGDSVLDPGWTDYKDTCLYSTYDITDQLVHGKNAIGVMLGNGMYNVRGGRYIKFLGSYGLPKLICRIQIDYANGTSQTIGTDNSWQVAPGPITFSCTYGGEDYDARLEIPEWNTILCKSDKWQPASATTGPGGILRSQYAPPIKVMHTFTPIAITEPKPGTFVIDLGQNFSGFPQISAIGQKGQTIRLWPGEVLNEDGTVCQKQSGTPFYYEYTFGSEPTKEITWAPRFTYYGFRYIQIEGAKGVESISSSDSLPYIKDIIGNFTYASAEKSGSFSCSNELINRIDRLIRMAIYSNFQSVFTDCPHREKLGWLEQCHLMANGLIFNLDLMRHYSKMMRDCSEAQLDNGLIPEIAPEYTVFSPDFRDSPEWCSAFILVPWYVYLQYGDTRLAEQYYDAMKKYVHYLKSRKDKNGMISHGLGDWCDVGPGPSGYTQLTSKEITATGVYYQDLIAMILFSKLFNKQSDIQEFTEESESVKKLFNQRLFHSDKGYYDRNSQTANALPLVVGLANNADKQSILTNLVSVGVRGATNTITAGDVGFSYLVKALTDANESEVLFDLVTQTNGPGYAYMLSEGCTSLHESWKVERGLSFNHFMLGHAEEWFYRGIGGITPSEQAPGYAKFTLCPQIAGDLTSANVTYQSIRGEIKSQWQIKDGYFNYNVTIPVNSEAIVLLPSTELSDTSVVADSIPAKKHPYIQVLGIEKNRIKLRVPSGTYSLSCKYVVPKVQN
jgi:hypothetical protein